MGGSGNLAGRVRLLAVAVLVVVAYGIIGYALFGFGLADAVSLTVLTLTTEGFAAPEPLLPAAKVFTASLALLGVTVFLAGLGLLGTALVEGQLLPGSRRRRMQRQLRSLREHFIVCAYGRVGRAVAREFEAEQIPFVVIDAKPELERDLQRDGVLYLIGSRHCCSCCDWAWAGRLSRCDLAATAPPSSRARLTPASAFHPT